MSQPKRCEAPNCRTIIARRRTCCAIHEAEQSRGRRRQQAAETPCSQPYSADAAMGPTTDEQTTTSSVNLPGPKDEREPEC
jgi:hypothetical protein